MHVLHVIFFFIIWLIIYIFKLKIVFNFKCIYVFAWVHASNNNEGDWAVDLLP